MPEKNLRGLGQSAPSTTTALQTPHTMDSRDFFDQIDLSALATDEHKGFKDWLGERPIMKLTITNALEKGQSVKAYMHTHRKQVEYAVRIED